MGTIRHNLLVSSDLAQEPDDEESRDQGRTEPDPAAERGDGEQGPPRPARKSGLPPNVRRQAEEISRALSRVDPAVLQRAREALKGVQLPIDLLQEARTLVDRVRAQPEMLDLAQRVAQIQRDVVLPTQTPQFRASMRQLAEALRRAYAPNWIDLDIDEDGLFQLGQQGISVVWVPRATLIKALLAQPNVEARRALLAASALRIVEDCEEATRTVQHQKLRPYKARLMEAVEAHRAGLHAAAQAISSVVLTALLQRVFNHDQLAHVKKSAFRAKYPEEVELWQLKIALLIEAAVPAVQGGRDQLPDEQLEGFNRHDTLHRVADQAYTLSNAMSALLLATGLLLEADQMMGIGLLPGEDSGTPTS